MTGRATATGTLIVSLIALQSIVCGASNSIPVASAASVGLRRVRPRPDSNGNIIAEIRPGVIISGGPSGRSRKRPRILDDVTEDNVSEGEEVVREEDEVNDEDGDGDGDESDGDDTADDEGGDGDQQSDDQDDQKAGPSTLVVIPTILLGLSFTIYMIYRWCKTRNKEAVFGQVDEYLSDFDQDESSISQIDLQTMSYSDAGSITSRETPQQNIPTTVPTEAEEREMI